MLTVCTKIKSFQYMNSVLTLFRIDFIAKKLPKSEPQSAGANSARGRGVDLTEPTQQPKSQCCSN